GGVRGAPPRRAAAAADGSGELLSRHVRRRGRDGAAHDRGDGTRARGARGGWGGGGGRDGAAHDRGDGTRARGARGERGRMAAGRRGLVASSGEPLVVVPPRRRVRRAP